MQGQGHLISLQTWVASANPNPPAGENNSDQSSQEVNKRATRVVYLGPFGALEAGTLGLFNVLVSASCCRISAHFFWTPKFQPLRQGIAGRRPADPPTASGCHFFFYFFAQQRSNLSGKTSIASLACWWT
jgi:hypothetical protein